MVVLPGVSLEIRSWLTRADLQSTYGRMINIEATCVEASWGEASAPEPFVR